MRTTFIFLFFLLFANTEADALPLRDFKFENRCLGDITVFTDLSCCNIDKWEWDFGDPASGASNKAYTKIAQHKYNSIGTYTVTLKIGTSGAIIDTIIKQVVICIPVKPLLLFHDTTICAGSRIFLYPLSSFVKYHWNTGDTIRTIAITKAGTYILCATNCDNGCLDCDTARVNVVGAPSKAFGRNTTTCTGDSIMLNAQNTGYKYLWNTGDTTQTIWAKLNGWYAVKSYSARCFRTDSTLVTFGKRVTIEFNTDTVGCEGDTLYLNPGWIYPSILWNYTDTNHVLKVFNSGLYPLRIINQGCITDTLVSVNFTTKYPLKLPDDTNLCGGDTLYVSSGIKATKYLWSNGDTTQITKIFTEDTFWLRVSFSGCYQTDTMIVKFKKKPVPDPIPKAYTCNTLPSIIRVNVPPGNNFQWWDGNTNTNRTFLDSGWHSYTVYNSCFTVPDSAYTGFYPLLTADPVARFTICFEDDSIIYLNAKKGATYLWKPGDYSTRSISPQKYGWYYVAVTDSGGCVEVDSFNIVRKCAPDTLLIPNAFSPNGDGRNDTFKPSFVRHVNYEFRVYDRWGELMFKTNDINEGWDGKYKSIPVAEDVYIYYVEVSGYSIFRQLKGTVHLIR